MSTRKESFASGEFYHIYNRGVDKRIIFTEDSDRNRFLKSMIEFNTVEPLGSLYENSFRQLGGRTAELPADRLVNIVAYCLNPNHFHFILEQVTEGGISEYMKRLAGGYTWSFNHKYKRSGSLFQGKFKSIHIDTNEYLLHVSAYVSLNDRVHQLGGSTAKLVASKSSWAEYLDEEVQHFCEKGIILEQFVNGTEYKRFALDSLESIIKRKSELKDIDAFLLE